MPWKVVPLSLPAFTNPPDKTGSSRSSARPDTELLTCSDHRPLPTKSTHRFLLWGTCSSRGVVSDHVSRVSSKEVHVHLLFFLVCHPCEWNSRAITQKPQERPSLRPSELYSRGSEVDPL